MLNTFPTARFFSFSVPVEVTVEVLPQFRKSVGVAQARAEISTSSGQVTPPVEVTLTFRW